MYYILAANQQKIQDLRALQLLYLRIYQDPIKNISIVQRNIGNLQIVLLWLDIVQENISVILTNIDSKGFLRRQMGDNDL